MVMNSQSQPYASEQCQKLKRRKQILVTVGIDSIYRKQINGSRYMKWSKLKKKLGPQVCNEVCNVWWWHDDEPIDKMKKKCGERIKK